MVSIPFKRESASQVKTVSVDLETGVSIPFKRESVSQDQRDSGRDEECNCVSIPFKRESVSQVERRRTCCALRGIVSIPFKRESVSQAFTYPEVRPPFADGFNSLQTGKCISSGSLWKSTGRSSLSVSIPFKRESVSQGDILQSVMEMTEFQFPSNGKVYLKPLSKYIKNSRRGESPFVSIPFKRESVSQV